MTNPLTADAADFRGEASEDDALNGLLKFAPYLSYLDYGMRVVYISVETRMPSGFHTKQCPLEAGQCVRSL